MTQSHNIQSHHHKSKDKNNTVNKVINIELYMITNCTALYHTTHYHIIKDTFRYHTIIQP